MSLEFNRESKQPKAVSFKDQNVLISSSSSCFPTSYIFGCWFAGHNQAQEKVGNLEKQSGSPRLKLAPKTSWFVRLWLCSFFAKGSMRKGIFGHTGVHHITLERVSKAHLRAFIYGQALSSLLPPDWKNENWKKDLKITSWEATTWLTFPPKIKDESQNLSFRVSTGQVLSTD